MPNRIEARSAKAALTNATGRLPLLRLFSTPLIDLKKANRRRKLVLSPVLNRYLHFCGTVPPIIACPDDDGKDDYSSQSSQAPDGDHCLVGCFLLFLHHS